MWWFLADIVLAVHILLWLLLGAGVVMATAGWMQRRKLALVLWSTMAVTLSSMAFPGCILTDLERWLRQMVVPGWIRGMSLARTVTGTVTGYHPPDAIFTALGVLLFSLAIYAFVRYHLMDVIAWLRRLADK